MDNRVVRECLLNLRNVMYTMNRRIYADPIDIIDSSEGEDCVKAVRVQLYKIGADRTWRQTQCSALMEMLDGIVSVSASLE